MASRQSIIRPIENYIYFYHTNTLIILPIYPDNVSDSTQVMFSSTNPLSRSAPIYSYSYSGPRTVTMDIQLHRDLLNQVNLDYAQNTQATFSRYPLQQGVASAYYGLDNSSTDQELDDYMDVLVNNIQTAAIPKYNASNKLVDPPVILLSIGQQISIKGVISGNVNIKRQLPIISSMKNPYDNLGKYAIVSFGLTINEIQPYSAQDIQQIGSWRNVYQIKEQTAGITSGLMQSVGDTVRSSSQFSGGGRGFSIDNSSMFSGGGREFSIDRSSMFSGGGESF